MSNLRIRRTAGALGADDRVACALEYRAQEGQNVRIVIDAENHRSVICHGAPR